MDQLKTIISKHPSLKAIGIPSLDLTYQLFGKPLHEAPIILVNHALTGNSQIAGSSGWWQNLVGYDKVIDLDKYTVIAFNIPWNGYQKSQITLPEQYRLLTTKLVAELFWDGIDALGIKDLYAIIGGRIGGSIGWEMAFLRPRAIRHLIPIACNYQASDWLIANVLVQESILNHSVHPIEDARKHAMLLYRTPSSFDVKFERKFKKAEDKYAVESWLEYHGATLKNRFLLNSYKIINHLLKTIGRDITDSDIIQFSRSSDLKIHIVSVNTDYMFTRQEQIRTYETISRYKSSILYSEIQSIHGHDAFLIEYEQLNQILKNNF